MVWAGSCSRIPWVPDCSSHFLVEVGMGVPWDGEEGTYLNHCLKVILPILSSVLHHAAS